MPGLLPRFRVTLLIIQNSHAPNILFFLAPFVPSFRHKKTLCTRYPLSPELLPGFWYLSRWYYTGGHPPTFDKPSPRQPRINPSQRGSGASSKNLSFCNVTFLLLFYGITSRTFALDISKQNSHSPDILIVHQETNSGKNYAEL